MLVQLNILAKKVSKLLWLGIIHFVVWYGVVNTKWLRLTRYELLYEEISSHQILASFYICHLGGALYIIICFYTKIGKYKILANSFCIYQLEGVLKVNISFYTRIGRCKILVTGT